MHVWIFFDATTRSSFTIKEGAIVSPLLSNFCAHAFSCLYISLHTKRIPLFSAPTLTQKDGTLRHYLSRANSLHPARSRLNAWCVFASTPSQTEVTREMNSFRSRLRFVESLPFYGFCFLTRFSSLTLDRRLSLVP